MPVNVKRNLCQQACEALFISVGGMTSNVKKGCNQVHSIGKENALRVVGFNMHSFAVKENGIREKFVYFDCGQNDFSACQ
jgi:hypothetical protein